MRKPLVDKILHLPCRKTRCVSVEVTAVHYYSDFSRTNPTGCAAAEELLGVVRKKLSYPQNLPCLLSLLFIPDGIERRVKH